MTPIAETFRYAFLGAGTINPSDLVYSFFVYGGGCDYWHGGV